MPAVKKPNLEIVKPAEKPTNAHSKSSVRSHQIAQDVYKLLVKNKLYLNPKLHRETLIQHINVDKNVLSGVFQHVFGTTLPDYVNRLRLRAAMRLLATSTKGMEEVALQSGYCSERTFYRNFHEKFGISPTAYRKSVAKKK
jgi:transcriptional regulator GlxA family with amidase domain